MRVGRMTGSWLQGPQQGGRHGRHGSARWPARRTRLPSLWVCTASRALCPVRKWLADCGAPESNIFNQNTFTPRPPSEYDLRRLLKDSEFVIFPFWLSLPVDLGIMSSKEAATVPPGPTAAPSLHPDRPWMPEEREAPGLGLEVAARRSPQAQPGESGTRAGTAEMDRSPLPVTTHRGV